MPCKSPSVCELDSIQTKLNQKIWYRSILTRLSNVRYDQSKAVLKQIPEMLVGHTLDFLHQLLSYLFHATCAAQTGCIAAF